MHLSPDALIGRQVRSVRLLWSGSGRKERLILEGGSGPGHMHGVPSGQGEHLGADPAVIHVLVSRTAIGPPVQAAFLIVRGHFGLGDDEHAQFGKIVEHGHKGEFNTATGAAEAAARSKGANHLAVHLVLHP